MKRVKLADRKLPDYTRGEEIFNMVSHIVGAALAVAALATGVVKAFFNHDPYEITAAFIYGFSMVILYVMSSIYHGLKPETAKKVFQVLDHCTIFFLIAGTYTPISLCALRRYNTALGWTVFGIVWGVSALGIVFNSIDLKRYKVFSMVLYIALGWCIVLTGRSVIQAITWNGFLFLLAGGVLYTVGAILYGIAGKGGHRYIHSVFHLFVVGGSILHYFCIFFYVLVP